MQTSAKIDIADLIDNSKWGSVQIGVFILCGLCLIMDGFDVQAIGYVAPAILDDWHIARADLGPVFSAGLFGVLVGSLLFSMLADKIGRRPVLIGASIYFSVATILTGRAGSCMNCSRFDLSRASDWGQSCPMPWRWWASIPHALCGSR